MRVQKKTKHLLIDSIGHSHNSGKEIRHVINLLWIQLSFEVWDIRGGNSAISGFHRHGSKLKPKVVHKLCLQNEVSR